MAKFVIAGKPNCPHFAKAELIGDHLSKNLPNFHINKILIHDNEWNYWIDTVCTKNNWKHNKSKPIVWRELVDRGGKGMYIGDANNFQEYVRDYYNYMSELTSDDLIKIAHENQVEYDSKKSDEKRVIEQVKFINVTITNPETPVLYLIIAELLNGNAFGDVDIDLKLYVSSSKIDTNLHAIRMEIEDLANAKLKNIKLVNNAQEAFTNSDYVVLFDELVPSKLSNGTEDQTDHIENPYIPLAKQINEFAKTTCKILITPFYSRGETYALVNEFARHLTRIDAKTNLIGNSMYDELMIKAILAHKLRVNPAFVKNILIFGQSLLDSFYIDLSYGGVTAYDGAVWARTETHSLNVVSTIADKHWVRKEFLNTVLNRESLIFEKTNRKAMLLFSQSVTNLIKLWNDQVKNGDEFLYSAIVYAKGNYSIEDHLFLSVPVKFINGTFQFEQEYTLNKQLKSIVAEIVNDTKKRISNKYKDNLFMKNNYNIKLSLPHVVFE